MFSNGFAGSYSFVPVSSPVAAINQAANKISVLGGVDSNSALSLFTKIRDYNNYWSAGQAALQRDWQERQNAKAMAFNASEAAKNRDWQQMMSNTAHQREVADLKAAGLNPVLSAMNGNGASVTSGATASGVTSSGAAGQTDTSLNSVLVNLLGSFLDSQTKLQTANINAINNLAVADKQGQINKALYLLKGQLDSRLSYQDYLQKHNLNAQQFTYEEYMKKWYPQTLAGYAGSFSAHVSDVSSPMVSDIKRNTAGKTWKDLLMDDFSDIISALTGGKIY